MSILTAIKLHQTPLNNSPDCSKKRPLLIPLNEIQNNCKFGCVSDFNFSLLLFLYKDSTVISSIQPEHQNHIILQVQEAATEAVQGSPCYNILWLFIQG